MNTIQNFERFPFRIRQPPDCNWCIPASIEVVTKYHEPHSDIDQHLIARIFYTKGLQLGLAQVEAALTGDPHFNWVEKILFVNTLHKFHELAEKVEEYVRSSTPAIISVPVGSNEENLWHMLVPVGYDESCFRAYNPAPNILAPYCDIEKPTLEAILANRKGEDTATDMVIFLPKSA